MAKLTDENRLSKKFPNLLKEWNYSKNTLLPNAVRTGSSKKAWWKCTKCNFEWFSRIRSRTNGKIGMCPRCAKIKAGASKVTNDKKFILSKHKNIMKKWDWNKNKTDPNKISCESHKSAWWKCDICDYKWKASIKSVYNYGSVCLRCRSIAFRAPFLITEWDTKKNLPLTINNTTYGYHKRVWWKCQKCHYEWQASPANRIGKDSGCPNCGKNIVLKNGVGCGSLIEAYYYLLFTSEKLEFKFQGLYGMGKKKYDFYLLKQNKYVEVTSFNKASERWDEYIKNIENKRLFVKNVLNASFEFIQRRLTSSQIKLVKINLK